MSESLGVRECKSVPSTSVSVKSKCIRDSECKCACRSVKSDCESVGGQEDNRFDSAGEV